MSWKAAAAPTSSSRSARCRRTRPRRSTASCATAIPWSSAASRSGDDETLRAHNEDDLRVVVRIEKRIRVREIGAAILRDGRRIDVIGRNDTRRADQRESSASAGRKQSVSPPRADHRIGVVHISIFLFQGLTFMKSEHVVRVIPEKSSHFPSRRESDAARLMGANAGIGSRDHSDSVLKNGKTRGFTRRSQRRSGPSAPSAGGPAGTLRNVATITASNSCSARNQAASAGSLPNRSKGSRKIGSSLSVVPLRNDCSSFLISTLSTSIGAGFGTLPLRCVGAAASLQQLPQQDLGLSETGKRGLGS